MRLEQTRYDNSETGCCARLDPARWNDRTFEWRNKPFLTDHIRAFLHVPLNYGSVISRDQARVQEAEAYPEEPFWLTEEVSPWGAELYVAIDRDDLPGCRVEHLSGRFLSRYFEGPYSRVGRWAQELEDELTAKGTPPRRLFWYYATCPKCAKQLGANQVVGFAQLTERA